MKPAWLASRLVQLGFIGVIGLVWHAAVASGKISPLLLPPPARVWSEFLSIVRTGEFWPDLKVTLYELAVAFLLAAIGGSAIGYVVSRWRYAIQVFDPLFAGLYAIPTILLIPLYILLFGLGPGSKIAMGTTIAFFPVVLNTIAGFSHVSEVYVTSARSMGASARQMFWEVMVPAAFPIVLTGLRMGLILAFLAILGTETIASISGLGHRIVDLAENMDTARMLAYVIFVILISLVLNTAVSWVEARGARRLA